MNGSQTVQFLADTCANILSDAFALAGTRPSTTWVVDTLASGPEPSGDAVFWARSLDTDPSARIVIGATLPVCQAISDRLESDEDGETAANRSVGFFRQVLADLSEITDSLPGGPLRWRTGSRVEDPGDLSIRFSLEIRYPDQTIAPLWLGCTSSFLSVIHQVLQREGTGPAESAASEERRFDMLLDVEMPITVSFGKTNLPLRDVMKLSVGSIVELNRRPVEPVDVIINNCVVARGEVVVVDGSYGLRVLEIIGQNERVPTR